MSLRTSTFTLKKRHTSGSTQSLDSSLDLVGQGHKRLRIGEGVVLKCSLLSQLQRDNVQLFRGSTIKQAGQRFSSPLCRINTPISKHLLLPVCLRGQSEGGECVWSADFWSNTARPEAARNLRHGRHRVRRFSTLLLKKATIFYYYSTFHTGIYTSSHT